MKKFGNEPQHTENDSMITDYGATESLVEMDETMPPEGHYKDALTTEVEQDCTVVEHDILVKDKKGNENRILPVVGWLICVKGPDLGKDFRLLAGYNNISRSVDREVVLSDGKISKGTVGWVLYTQECRDFDIGAEKKETGTTTVMFVNGKKLLPGDHYTLKHYDRIRLGDTELLFIPFCGADFDWEDEQNAAGQSKG